jgi:hypothetical protein
MVNLVAKLDTAQWAAHQKRLAADYWPAVIRGARAGALRGVAILQRKTQNADAFDTGRYQRAWKQRVSNTEVRFWNEAPYAIIIERGRRPGATPPPVKALIPWVKRKLGVSTAEAKGVAYVVARSIGRKGTKGKKVLIRAMSELREALEAEISAALEAVIRRV